jgi:ADP-ribosylglycohydrolase
MTTRLERTKGGLFGLALGDAVSYPAAWHRGVHMQPGQRRFQRRVNLEMLERGILRLMLPYGFGQVNDKLAPAPTDDTEFAVLTAKILIDTEGNPTSDDFVLAWQQHLVTPSDQVWTGFSERAAINNFKNGLLPPATGNDNPQFYDDSAVARAVPIGLAHAGNMQTAFHVAALDASVSHAEEGIWAAQAMAVAIAALAAGSTLGDALAQGREVFPQDTWLHYVERKVQRILDTTPHPADVVLRLNHEIITLTYSYANAAPETLPAAFAIAQVTGGDLWQGVMFANLCARASDSLPAMVGALAGTFGGVRQVSESWRNALGTLRGTCIPSFAGTDLDHIAGQLAAIGHGQ